MARIALAPPAPSDYRNFQLGLAHHAAPFWGSKGTKEGANKVTMNEWGEVEKAKEIFSAGNWQWAV